MDSTPSDADAPDLLLIARFLFQPDLYKPADGFRQRWLVRLIFRPSHHRGAHLDVAMVHDDDIGGVEIGTLDSSRNGPLRPQTYHRPFSRSDGRRKGPALERHPAPRPATGNGHMKTIMVLHQPVTIERLERGLVRVAFLMELHGAVWRRSSKGWNASLVPCESIRMRSAVRSGCPNPTNYHRNAAVLGSIIAATINQTT